VVVRRVDCHLTLEAEIGVSHDRQNPEREAIPLATLASPCLFRMCSLFLLVGAIRLALRAMNRRTP
jgi:hypothetical protein